MSQFDCNSPNQSRSASRPPPRTGFDKGIHPPRWSFFYPSSPQTETLLGHASNISESCTAGLAALPRAPLIRMKGTRSGAHSLDPPRSSRSAEDTARNAFSGLSNGPPRLRGHVITASLSDLGKLPQHRYGSIAMICNILSGGFFDEVVVYKALVFHHDRSDLIRTPQEGQIKCRSRRGAL